MGVSLRVVLLAVGVVGLAAWLFLYDLPLEQAQQQQAVDASVLVDFDPAHVDTLRVVRDNAPWTLARRLNADTGTDEWWLLTPIEERADQRTAANSLRLLLTYRSQRRLAEQLDGEAWGRYGLSDGHPARIDIVATLDSGQDVVLHVGNLDPTGDWVFVRAGGSDALHVAYSELADFALSSHHGFRERSIFVAEPEAIARLDLDGPSGSWTLERDADTGLWWTEIAGERLRLQRWEVDDLTHYLTDATVVGFQRDGLSGAQWSGYGLDAPWARIEWTLQDGTSAFLELGNETRERTYFGRRSGLDTVFEIQPGFEAVFERDLRAWVDANPIARNVRRARAIRVEDADGTWVLLERAPANEKDWIVRTAQGVVEPTEYLFVSARNVALGLEQLESDATMMLAAGSASSEVGRRGPSARLSWSEGPDVELVLWWREGESAPWMQIDGEPTLHRVERGLFLRLRAMIDAAHAGS